MEEIDILQKKQTNTKVQITRHIELVTDTMNEKGEFKVLCDDFSNSSIFLAFAMPGEKILFEKLKYKRDSYYNLIEILESLNPNRIKPKCPHFTICGGCWFQHMDQEFYKLHKMKKLENILISFKDKIQPPIVIPPGLRRKANFEAIKKEEKIFLGFHRYNSRQIINLETCKIIRQEIVDLLPPLKNLLNQILDDFQKAELFIVLAENGLDIGLEIQKVKEVQEAQEHIIQKFCDQNKILRFTFRHGNKSKVIFHDSRESFPFLKFSNFEVQINPWAFMQTSKEAEEKIISIIQKMIDQILLKDEVLDLFSGRGTYSLSLIHNFKYLKAIELSGESILELSRVAKLNNLPIEIEERDLFSDPLGEKELQSFDLVIINPPRAGAESQSIELSKGKVKNIIYVSCNPETFNRDLKLLEVNYKVQLIQPIDQFIWSNHLELIVWLKKI